MLLQVAWDARVESAFMAAYDGDSGQVGEHRDDVIAGREILFDAGAFGFLTARLERSTRIVVTGAAGASGGFAEVFDALEAYFPCVCVETYREGLVKMLKARGYSVDHVRLYKK